MGKIPSVVKTKITKLFKKGKDVKEIKLAVIGDYPKITPDRIRTIVKKHLMGLCDDLWSEAVKVRDGGKCVISNKPGRDSHHLIGRNNKYYRWDVKNGVTLSADHHTLGHDIAAHGSTDVTQRFAEKMAEKRPEQWAWFQHHKNNKMSCKVDIFALLNIAKRLQQYIVDMKKAPKFDILAREKL